MCSIQCPDAIDCAIAQLRNFFIVSPPTNSFKFSVKKEVEIKVDGTELAEFSSDARLLLPSSYVENFFRHTIESIDRNFLVLAKKTGDLYN
jgi:hypothetical protein